MRRPSGWTDDDAGCGSLWRLDLQGARDDHTYWAWIGGLDGEPIDEADPQHVSLSLHAENEDGDRDYFFHIEDVPLEIAIITADRTIAAQ